MNAILSSAGTSSATQAGVEQLRVLQAEKNADRAMQTAKTLADQAREARYNANKAQERARELSSQSSQAQTNAGRAQQGLQAMKTSSQMQTQLSGVATQVIERQETAQPVSTAAEQAPPVVNTQGQLTGTVVNTSA